jgi:hypothetical protein
MNINRRTFFRNIAFYVSPLCIVPYLIGYFLTEEKYRLQEWFIAIVCLVPVAFFAASLLNASSATRPGWIGIPMLLVSSILWLLSVALGVFTILVSNDPGWFH